MHGQFKNNKWRWLRKSDLKGCTEALICSAHKQSIQLTISNAILTKLASHPFVGCVIEEMRLYIVRECG